MKPKLSLKLLLTLIIVTAGLSVHSTYFTTSPAKAKRFCPRASSCKPVKCEPPKQVQTVEQNPWTSFSQKMFI